jgi:dienelactone hydrolase
VSASSAQQSAAHDPLAARPAVAAYCGPSERGIFAWYHAPADAMARDLAVVLCAPIGNESTGFPRAFRHWAEHLAASGVAAVRFDYRGFGDSAGSPTDAGQLRGWLDSVGDAVTYARDSSGASRVALVGLHFGATLALAAAAERDDIDALVLWVAYPTGKAYLREGRAFTQLMSATVDTEHLPLPPGAEQFGGLVLTRETIEAVSEFEPLRGERIEIPTLVIPRDAAASDATLMRHLTSAGADVERAVIDGYAGVMTEPHQSRVPTQVIHASTEWLLSRFPRALSGEPAKLPRASASAIVGPETERESAAAVVESPVRFGGNRDLFGIVSQPATGARRATGVLLVNAGAVYHVGPNRVYVDLARRWASLGYTVLRMDIGGLGDSPTPVGGVENHSYPSHVVADIELGLAELRTHGVERVVVGGLCSGAHATFHAGRELDSVDGLIVINPIVFYWKPTDPLDVGAWKTYIDARYYRRSARSWTSWLRLMQGHVNVPNIARIGLNRAAEIIKAKLGAALRGLRNEEHEPENAARDLTRIAIGGTDVFLLFSEGDPGLDFLKLRYASDLKRLADNPSFQLVVIDRADHTFTALDARQRAADAITAHLLSRYP